MSSNGENWDHVNGDSFDKVKQRLKDQSQVTYLCGVLGFGAFCFLFGCKTSGHSLCILLVLCHICSSSVDLLPVQEMALLSFGFLLLCQYVLLGHASVLSEKRKALHDLFLICRGIVFFTIRWWDPTFFEAMHPEGFAPRASWPYVESKSYLWTWLFLVPLAAYSLWQALYFLIVNVLRRQRLLRDPEVMTSYRELSKKARKANNIWWRLSGLLGEQNRLFMYIMLQALFTVATMALTVPIFLSYRLHVVFQIVKVSATVWNGGSFLLEVMPKQVILKEKKKTKGPTPEDQSSAILVNSVKVVDSADNSE
ncbi:hypothetical protein Acr_00g0087210 [Actinidia rufa]|uniref:Glycerophosphocholine acyltransferase 1 n=1 Tax=Actinidia rufa TaxID=165716 RepID=A0A7J0DX75_9ERIC|nr:hypothetical protein Acr_00g0087210 [Actinidia rufa]